MTRNLIQKKNISEQISDILKNSILEGSLKDGEKLPSEMKLAEIYNVSRLTVRSALQRLNALGLVTTKAGDGTYVSTFNIEKYIDPNPTILSKKLLNDVRVFRQIIEIECVKLIIENASEDELIELKINCDEYANIIHNSEEIDVDKLRILANKDFIIHSSLCKLSKNPLFMIAYNSIQDIIEEFFFLIISSRFKRQKETTDKEIFRDSLNGHTYLYNAIVRRDFSEAKKILINHIDYKVLSVPPDIL